MASAFRPTVDQVYVEVDHLRGTGLLGFAVSSVPIIAQMATEAGYAIDGDVTVLDIRNFMQTALGLFDQDELDSSAARLFALSEGMDLAATLDARMTAAAKKRHITKHAYSGRPPEGPKAWDMRTLAQELVAVHRSALRQREREKRNRAGMPEAPELVPVEPPDSVIAHLDGIAAGDWLRRRQEKSAELWHELLEERDRQHALLGELSPKLCTFASGSFGREEACEFSDLDLFLVDDVPGDDPSRSGRLDTFELGSALTFVDRARAARGIQQFSKGGYYQDPQSFRRMLVTTDEDLPGRVRVTTARALLLVNSKCFTNQELYEEARDRAMSDYWRDRPGSRRELRPTFLINDLRRVWLSQLVEFEHFYPKQELTSGQRISGADRRIAGLKLALPQKLGYYSPILGLLERSSPSGLSRSDAQAVLDMTTSQRLEDLATSTNKTVAGAARSLRTLYGQYLGYSWCNKDDMTERVEAPEWPQIREHFNKASTLILLMLWEYHAQVPEIARFALV